MKLAIGEPFPPATLRDIDDVPVSFPDVFASAPATIVFLYRGHW